MPKAEAKMLLTKARDLWRQLGETLDALEVASKPAERTRVVIAAPDDGGPVDEVAQQRARKLLDRHKNKNASSG